MKKIWIIFVFLLVSLSIILACGNKDTRKVTDSSDDNMEVPSNIRLEFNLNVASADFGFKSDWLAEHEAQLSDDSMSADISIKSYDFSAAKTMLPSGYFLNCPDDLIFVGWYFDGQSFYGNDFNEANWQKYAVNSSVDTIKLYGRWIQKGTTTLIFDLNNNEAYFVPGFGTSTAEDKKSTIESTVSHNYYGFNLPSAPNEFSIVPPEHNSFVGWYFEDGSELNLEGFLNQRKDDNGVVRAVAHWTEEDLVLVGCYINAFNTKYNWQPKLTYSMRISNDFYHEDLIGEMGSAACFFKVSRTDFDELRGSLPTRDDIELAVCYGNDFGKPLEESFAVFEWQIATFDENNKLKETVELSKENWLKTVEESETKTAKLVLYYELTDINKEITVGIRSNYIFEYPYSCSFTQDVMNKFSSQNQSYLSAKVERANFDSLLSILPIAEDVVMQKDVKGQGIVDVSNVIVDIEWKILIYTEFWDAIMLADVFDLTLQNWLELTKTYTHITLGFCYTLTDRDRLVETTIGGTSVEYAEENYNVVYNEDVVALFDDGSAIGRLQFLVDVHDYSSVLSRLLSISDMMVQKYDKETKTNVPVDLQIKTLEWTIVTDRWTVTEKELDLTEENWEYVCQHNMRITILPRVTF